MIYEFHITLITIIYFELNIITYTKDTSEAIPCSIPPHANPQMSDMPLRSAVNNIASVDRDLPSEYLVFAAAS